MGELPKIISVDDHVIEPPNVWSDRLPSKYAGIGPRIERKTVSNLKFNGTTYSFDLDPDGRTADFWAYEDLLMPHRRIIAAAGFPVDEVTLTPITYDEMRPGCYEQTVPSRGHGRQLGGGLAVVPDVPPVLRPDVPRGQGPRPGHALRAGLQRLDGRGVVRRHRRSADPALPDPPVGPGRRRRRGATQRGPRRARRLLQRGAVPPRPAQHPRAGVGPVLRGLSGDRHGGVHAHRLVVQDAGHLARRARRRCRPPSASATPCPR